MNCSNVQHVWQNLWEKSEEDECFDISTLTYLTNKFIISHNCGQHNHKINVNINSILLGWEVKRSKIHSKRISNLYIVNKYFFLSNFLIIKMIEKMERAKINVENHLSNSRQKYLIFFKITHKLNFDPRLASVNILWLIFLLII